MSEQCQEKQPGYTEMKREPVLPGALALDKAAPEGHEEDRTAF